MTGPIPAAAWLRAYERAWLRSDLVAGLTAAAVVVPQAMAYADIAGLPLAVGLYTALVPLVNRLGIELVGEVHGGLPAFVLPNISLFPHLWPAAVGIALMSFVEMAAAGRAFRGADEPQPEANRELLALV